jgi:hypothetical protein
MRIGHGARNRLLALVLVLTAGAPIAARLAAQSAAAAATYNEQVLYSFCSQSSCADGYQPRAGLIMAGGETSTARLAEAGPTAQAWCSR